MWYVDFLAGYLGAEHPIVGALLTLWALSLDHHGGLSASPMDRMGKAGDQ